jgi:hypothetical protein
MSNDILLKLGEIRKNSNKLSVGVARIIVNDVVQEDLLFNTVTGLGRTFSSQRMFGLKSLLDQDYSGYKISRYGFGSGGSTYITSSTNATSNIRTPTGYDTDLFTPISLSVDADHLGHLPSPDGTLNVALSLTSNYITFINTADLNDPSKESYNTYVKCVCTKIPTLPTTLNDDDYICINECALYFSNGINTKMFAHICFLPQYVKKNASFVLEWYILC